MQHGGKKRESEDVKVKSIHIRGRSIPRFGMEWIPGEINLGIAWN